MSEVDVQTCRLCLRKSEFYFSLFTGEIIHQVESLASVKIASDDELPQTCCEVCVANVYTSYKFQQCIIESDRVLKEWLLRSESKDIIEDAKQAPELFEVLQLENFPHLDLKIPKTEHEDDNNDICIWDDQDVKQRPIYNEIMNSSLQESSVDSNSTDLQDRGDVKHVNVDDIKLDASEVELLCNTNAPLGDELTKSSFQNSSKLYKDLETKEKSSEEVEEKLNGNANNPDELMQKLGIQKKFDKKLKAYREKQKQNQSVFECVDCEKAFESKRTLQRHMLKHKLETCPFCFITMRRDNLKRHARIHTDSPEVCDICGKIAKNKESLRGHINYSHKNNEAVKCETCSREFKSNHHYRAHVKKIHLGIRNKQCHICGKKFFANHDLNKHINMTHQGARPYVCPYCKKGFSSPYARKTHIRQHTFETPYRCEICAAGFRQKVSLTTHLRSKHPANETEAESE